ncbi:hypothetical protein D3C76_987490 [compost metagenome]
MVLADPGSAVERFDGGGAHRRGTGAVWHVLGKALHQPDQRRPVAVFAAVPVGEGLECVIGLGQVAAAQKWQGRLFASLLLALRVDLYLAAGGQCQMPVGFVQGQHMEDVAIRVDLAFDPAGQVQLPFVDALALTAAWRQAQELDAVADIACVAVGSVVANGQFHTTSR